MMLAFRRDVLAIMVNRVDINTILLLFWFKIKMMEGRGGGRTRGEEGSGS